MDFTHRIFFNTFYLATIYLPRVSEAITPVFHVTLPTALLEEDDLTVDSSSLILLSYFLKKWIL